MWTGCRSIGNTVILLVTHMPLLAYQQYIRCVQTGVYFQLQMCMYKPTTDIQRVAIIMWRLWLISKEWQSSCDVYDWYPKNGNHHVTLMIDIQRVAIIMWRLWLISKEWRSSCNVYDWCPKSGSHHVTFMIDIQRMVIIMWRLFFSFISAYHDDA